MTNEELFNWCCKQNCNRFFNCDLCMYEKGRADVWADIEKIINSMTNPIDTMKIIIEQLKEQNND